MRFCHFVLCRTVPSSIIVKITVKYHYSFFIFTCLVNIRNVRVLCLFKGIIDCFFLRILHKVNIWQFGLWTAKCMTVWDCAFHFQIISNSIHVNLHIPCFHTSVCHHNQYYDVEHLEECHGCIKIFVNVLEEIFYAHNTWIYLNSYMNIIFQK